MKGKGEKGGKSSHNLSNSDDTFPLVKPIDSKLCTKLLTVVNSDDHNNLQFADVDLVYSDVEQLLTAIVKQTKTLNGEIQTLNSWQEKGKVGSSPASGSTNQPECSPSTSTSQKRHGKGKLGDERPMKRMRTDSGRATYAQPVSYKGKGKNQHQQQDTTETTKSAAQQQIKIPKNITPLRFWAMVEPYCADITKDDIKYLEEQVKSCEDIDEFMRIPALGRHYSEKWKEEDEIIERREAEKLNNKRKNTSTSSSSTSKNLCNHDDEGLMIKGDLDMENENSSIFGPLTQRLVQALVEENLLINNDDIISDEDNEEDVMISDADAIAAATTPTSTLAKQLNVDADVLENRIKRELEALGILDQEDETTNNQSKCGNNNNDDDNDDDGDDDDDEILAEIRKKQRELKSLSQQNVLALKSLLSSATLELEKQDVKKKLATVDAEVVEAYRKLQLFKAKRKPPAKKDRDGFFKLLQDRKELLKQLHSFD